VRGSGVTVEEHPERFYRAEWRKRVACEIDIRTDAKSIRLRRREGESHRGGIENDVFACKMREMRAGGPRI
jgi:hypothetical protein